jgi:hypothetical protein
MRFTLSLLLAFLTVGCNRKEPEPPLTAQVQPAMPADHPAIPAPTVPTADPHAGMGAQPGMPLAHGGMAAGDNQAPVEIGQFPPADRTIADTLAHRQDLNGKTVEVRGRVTKANHGILDRNWLHLRDSSGEADLVVTTSGQAQKGDLVRAKGVVALDRDVGAGYKYELLIENATVVVEVPAPAAATPTAAPSRADLPAGHP